MSCTLKRLGIRHQVESGEPFTADRNLRMDIVVREEVSGTLLTGRSPSCWTSPMLTLKRRYTCEEAVLITMDQLPLPSFSRDAHYCRFFATYRGMPWDHLRQTLPRHLPRHSTEPSMDFHVIPWNPNPNPNPSPNRNPNLGVVDIGVPWGFPWHAVGLRWRPWRLLRGLPWYAGHPPRRAMESYATPAVGMPWYTVGGTMAHATKNSNCVEELDERSHEVATLALESSGRLKV